MSSQKDLLKEIDETIDQLIENASMIEELEADLSLEKDLLAQTQESLLAHLFHLDQKLNHKHLATCDYKKIKEFSLDDLNSLNCTQLLKPEKIKLSRSRLKNQSLK